MHSFSTAILQNKIKETNFFITLHVGADKKNIIKLIWTGAELQNEYFFCNFIRLISADIG